MNPAVAGGAWPRVRRAWGGRHEVALFALGYLVYFGVRAVTQGAHQEALLNSRELLTLERELNLDWETAVQKLVIDSDEIRSIANSIYIWGHWPVLIIGGVLLFNLSRRHYYRLRNVCLLSGAIGLLIFALFPVAPPRLSQLGYVDTITLHASAYRDVLPTALVNEYAAMPSFHAGWDLMLGIALFQASRNIFVRLFAVCMPFAMGFATVATANHFVVDVLAGAAIVTAAVIVVMRFERPPTIEAHEPPTGLPREEPETHAIPGRAPRRQRPRAAPPGRGPARPADRG